MLSSERPLERFEVLLKRFGSKLSLLCVIAAAVYFYKLPSMSHNTYVSENALAPGYADARFDRTDVAWAVELSLELGNLCSTDPAAENASLAALERALGRMDVQPHRQTWRRLDGSAAVNVYGRLVAPRSDGTEAVLLSADLCNADSVALVAALVRMHRNAQHLSKDVIVVFARTELPYESGVLAYLQRYHGASGMHGRAVDADDVVTWGKIRGGLHVDASNAAGPSGNAGGKRAQSVALAVLAEGIDGQLPNLDLINAMVRIGRRRGAALVLSRSPHASPVTVPGTTVGEQAFWDTVLPFAAHMAHWRTTGAHGFIQRFDVPCVTLGFPGTSGRRMHEEMAASAVLGVMVEQTLRSLNNLDESLHQSFYDYVLGSPARYVSIGDYLPGVAVLCLALVIALYQQRTINALPRATAAMALVTFAFACGACLWTVPRLAGSVVADGDARSVAAVLLVAYVLVSLSFLAAGRRLAESVAAAYAPAMGAKDTSLDTTTVHVYTLQMVCLCVTAVTLVNFPLGLATAALITPSQIAVARRSRAVGLPLLLLASPLAPVYLLSNGDLVAGMVGILRDHAFLNTSLFPVLTLLVVPVNLLSLEVLRR